MSDNKITGAPVCGVIYVASGEKFLREAETSLASLRATNPGLPAMLLTDQPVARPELWDKVEVDPGLMALTTTGRSCKAKLHMDRAPWDRCLFLDTDTLVIGDLSSGFALLDRFEFAADQIAGGHHYTVPGLPPAFPEVNSGVMFWRPTEAVRELFQSWRQLYDLFDQSDLGRTYDQKSLRVALWRSDVRYVRMPTNLNLMPYHPAVVEREMAVVHGRSFKNLRRLEKRMARSTELRAYVPGLGALRHPQEMTWAECLELVARTLAWKVQGLFKPLIRRS
jgi:hypothetical protein